MFRLSTILLDHAVSFDTDRHVLENSIALTQTLFPDARDETRTRVVVSSERREHGAQMLKDAGKRTGPLLMVHAGTDVSMKSWPFENYVDVAERLTAEFGVTPVFVGTDQDTTFYREKLGGRGDILVLATPRVDDLVGVASNADLFLGNDGGPVHLAAALGVPTLAVFGPTDERVYGPRGDRSRVVRQAGICGRKQYPWRMDPCCRRTGRECLGRVEVSTVLEAARDMLREHERQESSRAALV